MILHVTPFTPDTEQTQMRWWANNTAVDDDMPIESPNYWRIRGEEARALSEQMLDSTTKALMLEIADTYERIAKAYEEQVVRLEQPRET